MRLLDSEAPLKGSVQVISMSLNTFKGLTALRGEEFDMRLFSDDVLFIGNDGEEDAEEIDDPTLLRIEQERIKGAKTADSSPEEDSVAENV